MKAIDLLIVRQELSLKLLLVAKRGKEIGRWRWKRVRGSYKRPHRLHVCYVMMGVGNVQLRMRKRLRGNRGSRCWIGVGMRARVGVRIGVRVGVKLSKRAKSLRCCTARFDIDLLVLRLNRCGCACSLEGIVGVDC